MFTKGVDLYFVVIIRPILKQKTRRPCLYCERNKHNRLVIGIKNPTQPSDWVGCLVKRQLALLENPSKYLRLFPSEVIPNEEIKRLIEMAIGNVDAIITGGLITTEEIEKRLVLNYENWKYLEGNDSAYLVGAISGKARFVDVRDEIMSLRNCCEVCEIPFFEHSLQAINYLTHRALSDI